MSGRYYYEDEDELDVHITRQRSRSPAPHLYGEASYRHTRPPIHESYSYGGRGYERPTGGYLIPAGGRLRSHSQGRRSPSPVVHSPPPQPVIINNKIYNERDDDDDYYHGGQLSPFHPHRPRASSFAAPPPPRKEDYELEAARKQLAQYKLDEDKAAERKRVAKELELERLRKEKEEEEEEEKLKAERKRAIERYKADELERAAKEKKKKEEDEREYKERLAADMRKSGVDEKQIALVLKGEKAKPPPPKEMNRPIYTRMSRRHLSIETLNKFRVDFEFDQDPDYILIKRSVPEYEQDFWWTHTREIREKRHTLLMIESKERKHHHHHGREEVEFEFIRKKKHERKPSPSPLLTFLAGGKR